jgi:hypothetical protein
VKGRFDTGEVKLQYCPTEEMIGDYFTKPLKGKCFFVLRKIMGENDG